MPEKCTCGARLVEDALFCHKCGRPTRDIGPVEPEPPPAPPPLPQHDVVLQRRPAGAEISLHNRVAVRIALVCALGAFVLINLSAQVAPAAIWVAPWLTGAGFLAVYLYSRRTGSLLSVRSGARLGWLTGLFCFLIALALMLLTLALASTQGGFLALVRQQMEAQGTPNVDEMIRTLESPGAIWMVAIFSTVFGFLLLVTPPVIGGALCAKVLEKD